MKGNSTVEKIEKERAEFKNLILENPNYFGTVPEVGIKSVKPMKINTKYEELRCIGFHPEQDLLEAIIDVKLSYGYKGSLCSAGSFEYVRFFVDWNGDGKFTDAGIASVNVHNIPDVKGKCLDKTKPLSYAVTVKIDPEKKKCTTPQLVKVRAILSWDDPPPAGNPDHIPVWGNVIEKWIQIKPAEFFLKDIAKVTDLKKLNLEPSMLDLDIKVSKAKTLTPVELKEIYKGKGVPEFRFNFLEISTTAEKIKHDPTLMVGYELTPKFSKTIENVKAVLVEKMNTKYEELHCLGLNYDLNTLVATLTVKLPNGYNGSLCTKGSVEYVAFWAYVWDQIGQTCYWKHLGRSQVIVHDIETIPPEGLEYAVKLPVDLSSFWDACSKPVVLKIRAILSWQTKPPSNDPNYNPVWGNKVDAVIQIKPRPYVGSGDQKPFIWSAGGMAVESIAGNVYSNPAVVGSISDGYANGPSIGGGYSADESPFGGVIKISGEITNPPNIPVESKRLKYKVQYRKPGGNWRDITNWFRIWIRIDGVPSGYKDLTADSDGYFTYYKDLTSPEICEIQDDVLAQWHTPAPEGDGLYEIRMSLYRPPPATDIHSNIVRVMIDNKPPKAEISLDKGLCTKYTLGEEITGKFTATDNHIWRYSLGIEPHKAPVVPPTIDPTGETYPALPAPGKTNEQFKLTTAETTTPCGYVIYLNVWDRTIVNNYRSGNYRRATVGLCLL